LTLHCLLSDFLWLSVLCFNDLKALLGFILTIELSPLFHVFGVLTLRKLRFGLPDERLHCRCPALQLLEPLRGDIDAEHFGLVATQKLLVVEIADTGKARGKFQFVCLETVLAFNLHPENLVQVQ